jgi:hypothetical protein
MHNNMNLKTSWDVLDKRVVAKPVENCGLLLAKRHGFKLKDKYGGTNGAKNGTR